MFFVKGKQHDVVEGADMWRSKFLAGAIAIAAGGWLAVAWGGSAGAAPATAKVYFSNADDDSVAVIDVATQSILTTIPVGDEPRNLDVTPDGDTVYVPNRHGDSVSVISTATDTVTTTVTDLSFDEPYAVSVSPDGARAWVANKKGSGSTTGSVTVIDTATNTVLTTVDDVCFSSPEAILATASIVYVVNRGADNVCPIDSTTLAVGTAINVGSEPRYAVVTPDGSAVYVANNGGSVSKIATATDTVVATIGTGCCPGNLAILADGSKVYVPLQSDDIAIITTATDTFTTLEITGASSTYSVAISQVEGLAYVTDEDLDAVWVIDTATDSVVATVTDEPLPPDEPTVGLVDVTQGKWYLRNGAGVVTSFFYGNPVDLPISGDWDGDGDATPGLYRQSDGFFYARNSNTQGPAGNTCFAGDPSDIPIVGDWDGDGDDNLGIYRPSEQKFYLFTITCVGSPMGAAQISFLFGNPGDKPVAGDWDGDGRDEVGLHRESTGFFYWRNTLDAGNASGQIFFGDPNDRFVSGDWGTVDGVDTPAIFRSGDVTFYFRHTLTQGNADSQFAWTGAGSKWIPVSGEFGLG